MEYLLQEYFGLELFVYFKFLKFLLFSELLACFFTKKYANLASFPS